MSKNKSISILLGLILTFLVVGCSDANDTSVGGNGDDQADEEEIVLRLATQINPKHAWWEGTVVPWMERVEEITDGRVQFETFTSAELVAGDEELNALKDGTVDISLIHPSYYPDQFPLIEVSMLPLPESDVEIAAHAWKRLFESDEPLVDGKTFYESQIEDNGLFALAITPTWQYSLSTTGKEINTPDDVKGLTVRSPSRIHDIFAEKVGMSTATIAGAEVYEALSRGTVDGTFNAVADWTGWGYQDVLRYTITGLDFGYFGVMIAMSNEKWSSLPEDVQDAIIEAHEDVFDKGIQEWFERVDPIVEDNEEQGGVFVDFEELDSEIKELFSESVAETWFDYIDLLEESGLPGKELVTLWRDLVVQEGGLAPEEIMDLE